MSFVDGLPAHVLKAKSGSKTTYLYRTEMDLNIALAAMAEERGFKVGVQVPTALGGVADLVVTSPFHLVAEVKLKLTSQRDLRLAAEQVNSYGRSLPGRKILLAGEVNSDLLPQFSAVYHDVAVFDIDGWIEYCSKFSDVDQIARQCVAAIDLAAHLMGAGVFYAERIDPIIEAHAQMRAASRLISARAAA